MSLDFIGRSTVEKNFRQHFQRIFETEAGLSASQWVMLCVRSWIQIRLLTYFPPIWLSWNATRTHTFNTHISRLTHLHRHTHTHIHAHTHAHPNLSFLAQSQANRYKKSNTENKQADLDNNIMFQKLNQHLDKLSFLMWQFLDSRKKKERIHGSLLHLF